MYRQIERKERDWIGLELGQTGGSSSLGGLLKELHLLSLNSSLGSNFKQPHSIRISKARQLDQKHIYRLLELRARLITVISFVVGKQTMKQIYKEEELVIPYVLTWIRSIRA